MRTVAIFAAACAFTVASQASAQGPNITDVTGVTTTSSTIAGGAFTPSPGQVAVPMTPQVQAAIAQASATLATQLAAGTAPITSPTGVAVPLAVQQAVASVMTITTVGSPAAVAMIADITAAGAPPAAAAALIESVTGLLSSPAPGQLASAIGNLNAIVDAASVEFLLNPPPAFAAIQGTLAQLVQAAQSAPPAPGTASAAGSQAR